MAKKYITIIALYCLLCVITLPRGVPVWADDAEPVVMSAMETLLLERINQARSNPLETAASLGLDFQALLDARPDRAEALYAGLPPLKAHDILHLTALTHTDDMLVHDYYAKESPDGRTPEDRILAAGYEAPAFGETLGVVGFVNFITPEKAVDILFENMFRDEWTRGGEGPWNLLNPSFTDVGIGILAGTLTFGNTVYNAYVATCDFGAAQATGAYLSLDMAETALIHLINQARKDPFGVAESVGIDAETFLMLRPETAEIGLLGLPALAPNESLAEAARQHTEEMVAFRYFDQTGVSGQSVEDRLREHGYAPLVFSEVIHVVQIEAHTPLEEVVGRVFEALFLKALNPEDYGPKALFNPAFTEIGVGLRPMAPLEGESFNHVYVVTIDYAAPEEYAGAWVLGMVYEDRNQNGLFDAGEGIPGVPVAIDYANPDFHGTTDAIGGMQTVLAPGGARIVLWPGERDEAFWVDVDWDNQWFALPVEFGTGLE